MINAERKVLLLSGPQHFDERRPITGEIRRWAEHLDPLGIAIVAAYLKEAGFDIYWQEMNPRDPLSALNLEGIEAVFISSRFFDSDLARSVIDFANQQKIPVVAGGYGPTFTPERFGGAVLVKGEFEPVAGELIEDLMSGRLKQEYDARKLSPCNIYNDYKWPNRSIFGEVKGFFSRWKRIPQEWQRGCYNNCSFCLPTRLQRRGLGGHIRVRRVEDIIAEIEALGLEKGSYLFSTDLNTSAIAPEILRELFGYLQKKGIRWFTEGTIAPLIADLEQNGKENSLLAMMSPLNGGGCYSFLYGADDLVSKKVKGSLDKCVADLKKGVEVFRRFGIPLNLSVVVGLDNHTFPESFFIIRRVLEEVNAPYAFLHIATPYLGTPWGNKVAEEGRFLEGITSLDFNHRKVVHRPAQMKQEELQQGYYWLLRAVSSWECSNRSAKKNFDPRLWRRNPILGLLGTGLPWHLETRLTTEELCLRGFLDYKVQKELDGGYEDWRKRNS